jgi:hypothetical protein
VRRTRPLSTREWDSRAAGAARRIFASLDPFGQPFTPAAAERALLFPISYELEPGQLAALGRAAGSVGEETFFLESLVADEDERYWEIPLRDKKPYKRIGDLFQSAIFSSDGRWGMLISDEDHAVIGGPPEFMAVVAAEFPPTEEPAQHFWGPSHDPFEDAPKEASFEDLYERLVSTSSPIPMRSGEPFGDAQALAFIEFWKVQRDASPVGEWLPDLLSHVYGQDRAQSLLRAGGW